MDIYPFLGKEDQTTSDMAENMPTSEYNYDGADQSTTR